MQEELIEKLKKELKEIFENLKSKINDEKIAIYSFKSGLRILGVKIKPNFEFTKEEIKKINKFKQIDKLKKYFKIFEQKEEEFKKFSFGDLIYHSNEESEISTLFSQEENSDEKSETL